MNKDEEYLYAELEEDVIDTYKKIIASRYFTASHLEEVAAEAKQRIHLHRSVEAHTFYLLYMKGVYSLSISCSTYEEFDRRFQHFFTSMSAAIVESVEDIKHDSELYQAFLEQVLFHFVYDMEGQHAPWSRLLQRMLATMPVEHLEPLYRFLNNAITTRYPARDVSLLFSYVTLIVGKEKEALSLLTESILPVTEHEVTIHFQCLKKRERWETMKQWFTELFSHKPNGPYGSLQPLADEMQAHIHRDPVELKQIWNRWLLAPSYNRFRSLTRHLEQQEVENIVDELLPKMRERFHQIETVSTYMKLLHSFRRFDEASRYFLQHERDPFRLRPEKTDMLDLLFKERPDLIKPIYHQFVVRLVEKKSRAHYEHAVHFIKFLKRIYENNNERDLFLAYVKRMKKTYRTYRAFVEELKTIER